jgi:fructose-1,6-bisphosphatase/inositol monophosphatase family enzyme
MLQIETSDLVSAAINTIRNVQSEVGKKLRDDPAGCLHRTIDAETGKPALAIDGIAEIYGKTELMRELGFKGVNRREDFENQIYYLGEERLGKKNAEKISLEKEQRLVVLVDMIDGTDLLERGLSNWCSAMVFFDPQGEREQKIIAALVGIPDDGVYYATRERKNSIWKHQFHVGQGNPHEIQLGGRSETTSLTEASICFYGQQAVNLQSSVSDQKQFIKYLATLYDRKKKDGQALNTRIYNLAGMPMMLKMFDCGAGLRRIDAVFDVYGQHPHDMVAGAYIACAGGAVLSDLNGQPIDLEQSLLHPANKKYKLTYILASTEELRLELLQYLRKKDKPPTVPSKRARSASA